MPNKLPRTVKLLALELDANGHSQREIAEKLGISVGTITKAKHNVKEHGDIEDKSHKRGPKQKMDQGIQDVGFLAFFHY
jgi:transposase